ncbi:FAD-dependent oxidoreductase [Maritalea sp. S77]|uniref:FAD-dependent oxidoreductase n=1 Tax=Maritalea sp. S77 TaxID=3415125 RepID=UPI003C7BD53B
MAPEHKKTQCCIAGGGPAGVMLGYLLARAGVDVIVLEKHVDFFRDFRGDTVHPSTLEVMNELGLLEKFRQLPHQKVEKLGATIGKDKLYLAEFSHLKNAAPYIAFVPQWDFLNFLTAEAKKFSNFQILMGAEAFDLRVVDDEVAGLYAKTSTGIIEIEADLTVGADGRGSAIRECAGLEVEEQGVPIDVLWFSVPRDPKDGDETEAKILPGSILIMINRDSYWQCAFVIGKGELALLKEQGLAHFRRQIMYSSGFTAERLEVLDDWEKIRLLTVKIDYLKQWHHKGLLCIGDAAHAMSPVGGVGINLAIQDAVAAANLLYGAFNSGAVESADLSAIERRRRWPTRATQFMQRNAHERILNRVLETEGKIVPPWILKKLANWPTFRRFVGGLIGNGLRPEHVDEGIIDAEKPCH